MIARRWNGIFEDEGSVRAVCLLRILLGPVVLVHLQPFFADMRAGRYYGDAFYSPWFSWYPEAPRDLYFALLWAAAIAAVLMMLGILTRAITAATFLLCAYNFFLSETHFRHNRAFLLIILAGVALLPSGKVLSLDALWRRQRDDIARLWPLYLLRFEHVSTYFASGLSKLIDPDWWGGTVTWDRVLRFRDALDRSIAPDWLKDLVTRQDFHWVFAKVNILTELFLLVALWLRPTRLLAIWVAIVFHLMIEISARVQVFSLLAIAAQLIWVTPSTRDRLIQLDRSRRGARVLGAVVRGLDWLARFRVEDLPPGAACAIVLVDRDGRRHTGGVAARLVLSRLPLAFFPCAPLRAVDVLRGR